MARSDGIEGPDERQVVHRVVAQFERDLRAGLRPSVEEALGKAGPWRASALVELIHSELEWRLKGGEPARVEDYLGRFPELNRDRKALVDLLAAEWTIRRRTEPTLEGDEYFRRFPGLHASLLDAMARGSTGLRATLPLDQTGTAAGDEPEPPLPARFGRFELRERVGRGSFGRVYRAWDTVMRRQVALKLPRRGKSTSPEDVRTFLREARTASGLVHPHIVQVYEAAEHEGMAYIVSEYIEGRTLSDVLGDGLPATDAAVTLMTTVLDALQAAHEHEQPVIHRDLKPSNILIDARGRPHLTDFGLAQREGGDGSSIRIHDSMLLGTLAYMSPEQALGHANRVDARSDVFAAGIVLYEMLTGELPFRGRGRMLQVQITAADPTPPRRLNESIPAPLESICLRALAKDPAERYASARAMAEDLRAFAAGRAVDPGPAPRPLRRAWRLAASRPWRTIALLYALVACLALPILVLALIQVGHQAEKLHRQVIEMKERGAGHDPGDDPGSARALSAGPVMNGGS